MQEFPVNPDLVQKHRELPALIARLSYLDEKEAIKFIRLWADRKIKLTELHDQLTSAIKQTA